MFLVPFTFTSRIWGVTSPEMSTMAAVWNTTTSRPARPRNRGRRLSRSRTSPG